MKEISGSEGALIRSPSATSKVGCGANGVRVYLY